MTINCNGNLVDLTTPRIMGILNVTPDSFFDGGKYHSEKEILNRAEVILGEGADFIDMGGYSSRPKAVFVEESEEFDRIVAAVELVARHFPEAIISIDTFRAKVAKACVEAGASVVNDISAGMLDEKMIETVSQLRVPYVMMHMRGTPQTMHIHTDYTDIISEMLLYFSERIAIARNYGISDIILDPGFGFSKTIDHNFEVMQKLELFNIGMPLLVGISRKGMIYKSLETSADEAINGTTALHMASLMKGAGILRVHDVKEAKECVKLFTLMNADH